ncbi:MAG: ABC transporter permease, partial [candidate division Zixibacteria bacterium]|nr:ABC transporter permease [candidate division Zixibacteria bacterium]
VVGGAIETVEQVEHWTPRLFSSGLASVGDKSSGVRIIGIDPERETATTRFDKKVTEGRCLALSPSHEALLGEGLAKTLRAKVGDEVVIVSQAADGSIANDLYQIVGLVSSGDGLADRTSLYLHLAEAQELLVLENRVHEIAVVVEDLDDLDEVAAAIRRTIQRPEVEIATWHEFARSFYTAMRADQQGSWIMLFVIILVVAVGVLNTVLMTVLERTREYGVLRAIGTAPAQIFRMVLIEVLIMAVAAVILGSGVSYVANYVLSVEGIELPTAITYGGVTFDRLFTIINARSFYIPTISVLLMAAVASLLPAGKASRIPPARAMRTH